MVLSCIHFGSEHGVLRGYEVKPIHVRGWVVEALERGKAMHMAHGRTEQTWVSLTRESSILFETGEYECRSSANVLVLLPVAAVGCKLYSGLRVWRCVLAMPSESGVGLSWMRALSYVTCICVIREIVSYQFKL